MITSPDRLAKVKEALERGEPVDLQTVAALQALDLASFGRQFMEEAVREHERIDQTYGALLEGALAGVDKKPGVA